MSYINHTSGFRDKKRIRHAFYLRGLAILLFVALIFSLNAALGSYSKYKETKTNKIQAQMQLEKLREREENIQKEIARLKTDRGVEEEIRGQFGLARAGEGVIVIVESHENSDLDTNKSVADVLGDAWSGIKGIFR